MSSQYWLISVPKPAMPPNAGPNAASEQVLRELGNASQGLTGMAPFELPQLKVGTLDQLMALSEDTNKMDTYVGGVAKKIEKTYYEMWKTEATEAQAMKERSQSNATNGTEDGQDRKGNLGGAMKILGSEEKAPELRIGDSNKSAHEFVTSWQWNDVRYDRRSPLRALIETIMKDTTKSDEALKKQVAEYNEVRTSFTAIERKDQGTLLVKPLGPYVKSPPVETAHLTTLMIVLPKNRLDEFNASYETLEIWAKQRDEEESLRKKLELEERQRKDAERQAEAAAAAAASGKGAPGKTEAQLAHEKQKQLEKEEQAAKEAEAAKLEAELTDQATKEKLAAEAEAKKKEEEQKNKKLPCNAVVPRSLVVLCNEPNDEFVLVSVIVLKQGSEHYKNLIREKRYTIRPFKYDPEDDKLEKNKKMILFKKKRDLWNFLIRWCTTTYTEVFTAWIHLKAIRLYVEAVLRYGLPYNAQSILLEPYKQKEKPLRDVLKVLYGRLAGNNANLTTALDPNEPDLSGLGSDFYPYVYLPLTLGD